MKIPNQHINFINIFVGSKDCFVIEINEEEHCTLIKDITNKLTMQIKKQIRGKKGHIGIKVFLMLVLLERKIILIFCYLLKEIVAATGIVITYNESIIKTLEEEKEYNDLNYYNMKKAPDYKKRYLLDEEANVSYS